MRYFNVLGSLIFFVIGFLVLIKGEFFTLQESERYMYSIFFFIGFFATQGVGVVFRKPGKQSGFYWDLFFSTIPLFIVYEAYVRPISNSQYYEVFMIAYFATIMIDLIIFTPIAYRFAMMSDEYILRS